MKLEGIRTVTMSRLFCQVGGQVDDRNGIKRALLDAYAATDAKLLGNLGQFGRRFHVDAEFFLAILRAGLFAFLATLFGFTFVSVDDGYASQCFFFFCRLLIFSFLVHHFDFFPLNVKS
jgi:hypothetical protein